MKKISKVALSQHLLEEANRYNFYPQRVSPADKWVRRSYDEMRRTLVEWRKTFADDHDDKNAVLKHLGSPNSLDEFYCRDLLKKIPDIVDRTLRLKNLTLQGFDSESTAYLSAAANCYILDLPEAAVALARAAVEDAVRKRLVQELGAAMKDVTRGDDLEKLIDQCFYPREILTGDGRNLAQKVRRTGNDVLHKRKPIKSAAALDVIEAARRVILELKSKKSIRN